VLFMVIEKFKPGDLQAVGERFARQGRMLPDDVSYESSWMEAGGGRCFQLMRAPTAASLEPWIARWSDLVAFEVIAVMPSAEFWATRP
jgi:Protein of unknown function (DUF3303)